MNLREEIKQEHSKARCDRIVQWVGESQDRFDALAGLFFSGESRISQRAAWPLSYCVMAYPAFIRKHIGELVQNMQQPGIHNAVKRNTLRLLQVVEIPEEFQGTVMDLCFGFITDPQEKAAIKAFSLTVLQNLSELYPEILPEILLVIEERWDTETPAFKARSRRILKLKDETGKT